MCVPLAEKDALWVVESVEVGLCDKELHAVAEPLGEPEDDEDTDDVRQRVEDGLLLLEPVKLPLPGSGAVSLVLRAYTGAGAACVQGTSRRPTPLEKSAAGLHSRR